MNNLNGVHKKKDRDEWYTLFKDVQNELDNYDLTGLKIVCPCDGKDSAFVKYMSAMGYDFDYFEGDYESVDYSKYDVVITNPPFKNYQKFYNLIKDKLFIVVAPLTVAYKSWFRWETHTVGYTGRIKEFYRPSGEIEKLGNVVWITNMKKKLGKPLDLCNNFDGVRMLDNGYLEVSRIKDIPNIIGQYFVPITLFEYTPLPPNIKILGVYNNCTYRGKKLYTRFLIEVK